MRVLGPDTDLGVRRLAAWRLQGVRNLTVVLAPQIEVCKPVTWWLRRAVREGIWRRLGRQGEKLWALSRRKALRELIESMRSSALTHDVGSGVLISIYSL